MTDYVAGDRPLAQVPRTTPAATPEAVALAASRRLGPPPAVWGIAIVIASEGMLFGCLVASYFYLRFNTAVWPPDGIAPPKLLVPLVLLACLLAASAPMLLASRAARTGRLNTARLAVTAALVVQAGYFAYEVHDFGDQLNRLAISRDAYASIYYTLLGADHAHVFVGLLLDVWLLGKLARGLTTYRANATQAIAWYWIAVNLITVVVIGTLLSARA